MSGNRVNTLNQAPDVTECWAKPDNTFFLAADVERFDENRGEGCIRWERYAKKPRFAFNQGDYRFERTDPWIFPNEYAENPVTNIKLSFVTPRTVRIQMTANERENFVGCNKGPMLVSNPLPRTDFVQAEHIQSNSEDPQQIVWTFEGGSVTLCYQPFRLIFKDADGKELTRTQHFTDTSCLVNTEPVPFSFVRSTENYSDRMAASFTLSPQEKLFGCGESFTRLNKRGQKLDLWVKDAHGAQTAQMYKPIPFMISSRGYGMFIHSSAPMSFDMGHSYDSANVLYTGDENLDLFFFFGTPKQILSEYTALTGRSPVPPLWSFGLWMSRITYKSEEEVRSTAAKHRQLQIPCDVIHLDTGWFEKDWRCDYQFSNQRFTDAKQMTADLLEDGFRISLWQIPYFTPTNPLYEEILQKGLAVKSADGKLLTEDAILDFSNPEVVRWYQEKIAALLKIGAAAIKVDFGEAAPRMGLYASGKSGYYEHNLYPLRYNQAVADITMQTTGDAIIWARSAWAGSQRYPIHWGGDAEITDGAMAASLRAGLSLGLCGFSYWSNDIGGFTRRSPQELYERWLPFGLLVSHSRCHGSPPKEPWEYGADFTDAFRSATELRYRLMPYIYTQAQLSSQKGHPMIRTLFFEFPEDEGSWHVEDQYMFGSQLLVAPLFEAGKSRKVYLPPGGWIDYQTGTAYAGSGWKVIEAGKVPVIILVRSGSIIPHAPLAQSTDQIKWQDVYFEHFAEQADHSAITGLYYNPVEEQLYELTYDASTNKVVSKVHI